MAPRLLILLLLLLLLLLQQQLLLLLLLLLQVRHLVNATKERQAWCCLQVKTV